MSLPTSSPTAARLVNPHSGSLDAFWIPFTPNRDFKSEPRLVARAKGLYYYDLAGRPIIDGVSGLFASAAGHGREEIAEAVHQQLKTLDYSSSF